MTKKLYKENDIKEIANAIRLKTKTTDKKEFDKKFDGVQNSK